MRDTIKVRASNDDPKHSITIMVRPQRRGLSSMSDRESASYAEAEALYQAMRHHLDRSTWSTFRAMCFEDLAAGIIGGLRRSPPLRTWPAMEKDIRARMEGAASRLLNHLQEHNQQNRYVAADVNVKEQTITVHHSADRNSDFCLYITIEHLKRRGWEGYPVDVVQAVPAVKATKKAARKGKKA